MRSAYAVAIYIFIAGAVVVAALVQIFEVINHAVHDLNGNGHFAGSQIEPRGEK
jgi:hypothetical protein